MIRLNIRLSKTFGLNARRTDMSMYNLCYVMVIIWSRCFLMGEGGVITRGKAGTIRVKVALLSV
jgi:hypothetical protein